MFKALAASVGAFLSDPLKFISNPEVAVLEYQIKKGIAEGKTAVEVEEELKQVGLIKGPGPVKVIVDKVGSAVEFTLSNLPGILLIVALLFVSWWGLRLVKVLK